MRLRSCDRGDREIGWLWFAAAAGTLVLRPLWPAMIALAAPGCLFRLWTGIPCPTCGATRSVLAMLDGRIVPAVAFNPLVAIATGAFLAGGIAAPFWVARGLPVLAVEGGPSRRVVAAALAVVVANWAWLLASGRV